MRDVTGNLWTIPADGRAISTNGSINARGAAIMGRGCAREAKQRYPDLPFWLADALCELGNHVCWFPCLRLFTFPVKHRWHDRADLELITRSAHELVRTVEYYGFERIAMPRPGCGNGGLRWDDVRPRLAPILDDRFLVVHWGMEGE